MPGSYHEAPAACGLLLKAEDGVEELEEDPRGLHECGIQEHQIQRTGEVGKQPEDVYQQRKPAHGLGGPEHEIRPAILQRELDIEGSRDALVEDEGVDGECCCTANTPVRGGCNTELADDDRCNRREQQKQAARYNDPKPGERMKCRRATISQDARERSKPGNRSSDLRNQCERVVLREQESFASQDRRRAARPAAGHATSTGVDTRKLLDDRSGAEAAANSNNGSGGAPSTLTEPYTQRPAQPPENRRTKKGCADQTEQVEGSEIRYVPQLPDHESTPTVSTK